MAQFLGTHQNKLDAKGRVSVPAPFRAALKSLAGNAETTVGAPVVLRRSHQYACIEAWGQATFEKLADALNDYEKFSQEHEDFAMSLYADAYPMDTDKEGRILLPADLVAHAGLTDSVTFIGMGETFQIWEPEAAERRRAEARERARLKQLTLRSRPDSGTSSSGTSSSGAAS
jgi:MraZ protein